VKGALLTAVGDPHYARGLVRQLLAPYERVLRT
jgi:hypothetical protein